jgi:hypothetical protein
LQVDGKCANLQIDKNTRITLTNSGFTFRNVSVTGRPENIVIVGKTCPYVIFEENSFVGMTYSYLTLTISGCKNVTFRTNSMKGPIKKIDLKFINTLVIEDDKFDRNITVMHISGHFYIF